MTTAPATENPLHIDPRMGAFIWWDLESCRVTPDHLRDVLRIEGLTDTGNDTDIKVPDIDPTSAIRRACQSWAMGRGNADRYRAEVTADDNGQVYVGLLQRQREGAREVAWKQVETLRFDLAAGAWSNTLLSDQATDFLATADDFIRYHDHRFVRPGVLTPLLSRMGAISLRSQGGIYFVPLANMDAARQMKRVIGALGNSKLHICTVENDADARDAVSSATQDHVLGQLVDVQAQLEEWKGSARKIRSDSQANVLGQLGELLSLASLYERTLEVSLKDLKQQVEDCQDAAMAILASK